jgi:hypothetical protein
MLPVAGHGGEVLAAILLTLSEEAGKVGLRRDLLGREEECRV